MKKHFFAVAAVALVAATLLSGCALYGNDRSGTSLMEVTEDSDAQRIICRLGEEQLIFDTATQALSVEETEWTQGPETILKGDTFPRGVLKAKEGYEPIIEQVTALALKPDDPLVHALAWEQQGTVYGFCNVYSKATGFLSGGGQCDTKHIVKAVLFTYENDTLIVREQLDGCVVVAYDGTNAIYFKDRVYYSKGEDGAAKQICNDEAFDTGTTSYGYARFYFNDRFCVMFFNHDKGNAKTQYHLYILTTLTGDVLAELRILNPYNL